MPDSTLPLLDVSLVVNIHAGHRYLRRTMRSLEASAIFARADGLRIELLLALDRSPEETLKWAANYTSDAFERIRAVHFDNGSLGLSRQQGLEEARAKYIQFCDEDDLVSMNTTLALHNIAIDHSSDTIIVPEYLYGFGSTKLLAVYAGSEHIPPLAFLAQHPYISRIFVHRDIANLSQYVDVPVGSNYAYEDWHFNATAVAKGAKFVVAPGVILFYRHRASSLSTNMTSQSTRLIPPTPLFDPRVFVRLNADRVRRLHRYSQQVVDPEKERARFLSESANLEEVQRANLIDPAVSLDMVQSCPIVATRNGDFATGLAYFEACKRLAGQQFNEVAIFQRSATAQGEAVLATLQALSELDDRTRSLILLDDGRAVSEIEPTAPGNSTVINLAELTPGLSSDQKDLIAYRLIENVAGNARVHFGADEMSARFLGRYKRLLVDRSKIIHRGDDQSYMLYGRIMVEPGAFDFLSEFLDDISLVLHTSRLTQEKDRARLDRLPAVWRQAYLPVADQSMRSERFLSRKVLAVGIPESQVRLIESACRAAGTLLSIEISDFLPEIAEPDRFDVVLIRDRGDVTYRELLRFVRAGLPIIGTRLGALAEVFEAGLVGLEVVSTGDGAYSDYVARIVEFYSDDQCRLKITTAIAAYLDNRHSPEAYRPVVSQILLAA